MATGSSPPPPTRGGRTGRLGRYAPGAVLVLGVCAILLWPILRDGSPVVKREPLEATVEAIVGIPVKPVMPASDGYRYQLRIQSTGETVVVSDFIARPHAVGSQVTLERRTRLSGISSYHFVP